MNRHLFATAKRVKGLLDRTVFPAIQSIADDAQEAEIFAIRWDSVESELQPSASEVRLYHRSYVLPEVGVAHNDRGIIRETAIRPYLLEHYLAHGRIRKYPPLIVRGTVASLNVGTGAHNNYYHQWIDALPRAWLLSKVTLPSSTEVKLLVTGRPSPEFVDLVRSLGGEKHRLVRVPRFVRIFPLGGFLHLPVPSLQHTTKLSDGRGGLLPAAFLRDFRATTDRLFHLDRQRGGGKIYVSRRDARGRRLVNDLEISRVLERNGFETVQLERMSVVEQMRLFRGADLIVAQHGAALTNLLHCRPGTRVLEIFNETNLDRLTIYERLASQMQLVHRPLELNGRSKDADAHCPVDDLLERLDALKQSGS